VTSGSTQQSGDSPPPSGGFIWAFAGLAVIALGALAFWLLQVMAPQPGEERAELAPLAEFATIEPVGDSLSLPAQGFVQAPAQVAVVSEVSGRITEAAERLVSGTRFRAGDLLVSIDDEPFRADLAEAEAAVSRAEVELRNADNQLARIRQLEAQNFSARSQLEDAQINRQRAESALEQARASVERARIRLDDTRITAPFDSEIISEDAAVGRFVSPGEEIARLFATDFGEIRLGISRREAALLAEAGSGDRGGRFELARIPTEVVSGGGAVTYAGVVDRVEPVIDTGSRTVKLVVRVDDAFAEEAGKPPLLLEDLVEVRLQLVGRKEWWRLPATALKQPDRLWRLADDDTLEPLEVRVLFRADDQAVVESAELRQGDRVLLTDLASPVAGLEVRPRKPPER
jgi:RND family efflux transporter MFP subunit